MANTKHMAGADLLRIRKLMGRGMTTVEEIQAAGVQVHASRIQEALDVGLPDAPAPAPAPAPAKKAAPKKAAKRPSAADKAKAAAAAKVDPLS